MPESSDNRAPLISVEGLVWTPPDSQQPVLRDIDLEVSRAERVVLRGSSGSGKSTLLRCIIGLEERTSGRIEWRGRHLEGDDYLTFRDRCRYVPQRPVRIAETIEEDLAFASEIAAGRNTAEPRDQQKQRDLLDRLGIGALEWNRGFAELSVGEQQRVALVRALTSQPDVLLLDEPTSALDPERVEEVESLLVDYVASSPDKRAFVWVTHSPDQASRIDGRVVDMDELNAASPSQKSTGDGDG